jgi:hypothetical protein
MALLTQDIHGGTLIRLLFVGLLIIPPWLANPTKEAKVRKKMRAKKMFVFSLTLILMLVSLDGWSQDNYFEGQGIRDTSNLLDTLQVKSSVEPETGRSSQQFLWGIGGFGITLVSGVVGIVLGGQGGTESDRAFSIVGYGIAGCFIGAAVSLSTAAIFSISTSSDVNKPTFWGTVIGWAIVPIIAMAMYPQIPAAELGLIIVLPVAVIIADFMHFRHWI